MRFRGAILRQNRRLHANLRGHRFFARVRLFTLCGVRLHRCVRIARRDRGLRGRPHIRSQVGHLSVGLLDFRLWLGLWLWLWLWLRRRRLDQFPGNRGGPSNACEASGIVRQAGFRRGSGHNFFARTRVAAGYIPARAAVIGPRLHLHRLIGRGGRWSGHSWIKWRRVVELRLRLLIARRRNLFGRPLLSGRVRARGINRTGIGLWGVLLPRLPILRRLLGTLLGLALRRGFVRFGRGRARIGRIRLRRVPLLVAQGPRKVRPTVGRSCRSCARIRALFALATFDPLNAGRVGGRWQKRRLLLQNQSIHVRPPA